MKNKLSEYDKQKHYNALKYNDKIINANGYSMTYYPEHFKADVFYKGYVLTHVLVYEYNIGRYLDTGILPSSEVVHHKNHRKLDNRFKNLKLMTQETHGRLHGRMRAINNGIRPYYDNYDWMYEHYILKDMSQKQLAKLCNSSRTPIKKAIDKFDLYKIFTHDDKGRFVTLLEGVV